MSAVGTFAEWVGKPRPNSRSVAYLLRGERLLSGPLPKIRVHDFPILAALRNVHDLVADRVASASYSWLQRS